MYITEQGCRLRNDLYCVEWDVKLYYTIPYHMWGMGVYLGVSQPRLPYQESGVFSRSTIFGVLPYILFMSTYFNAERQNCTW